MKKIIFWLKVKLGIIQWIDDYRFYQEGGRIFCKTCGDFGWKKRGDADIHDMHHWD